MFEIINIIMAMNTRNVIISSIITTSSVNRLNLNVGDEVQALVKASEISIKEVIS